MTREKIVAIILVRMGSQRLPGKIMKQVLGRPLLYYLIERVKRSLSIDEIVVATSTQKENDVIESFAKELGVQVYRGSEGDVLGRTASALKAFDATVGVQIYGDNPLIDPKIIDSLVTFFLLHRKDYDFVGNDLKTTYPPGSEVEVYDAEVLKGIAKKSISDEVREHGTLYLRSHPGQYRLFNVEAPEEFAYPELEVELDTEEDLFVIQKIIEDLYPENENFELGDIIQYLRENSELSKINRDVPRRWKAYRGGDSQ